MKFPKLQRTVLSLLRRSPYHKKVWDNLYRSGELDRYRSLEQFARYSVIEGYCRSLKTTATVLDVGCGAAILAERFCPNLLAEYTGTDISVAAIHQAQERYPKGKFVIGDIRSADFGTSRFDFIIFNESLYSVPNYEKVLHTLRCWLMPDGHFIVSINTREELFLEQFEQTHGLESLSCTHISDKASGKSWRIFLLK